MQPSRNLLAPIVAERTRLEADRMPAPHAPQAIKPIHRERMEMYVDGRVPSFPLQSKPVVWF